MSKIVRSETADGVMLSLAGDMYVGRSLELYGEYSVIEAELLHQLVRPGSIAVEVGANIGALTIGLARACAPGHVFAFEPQQRAFQVLCANLVANGVENVTALPEACGASTGKVSVPVLDYDVPQNFGSLSLLSDEQGRRMPTRLSRIDDIGLQRCDLIKVDVEGYEIDVVAGARDTITRLRPILYLENAIAELQQGLIDAVHELGYRQWWHAPKLYRADNFRRNPENVFGNIASLNILAIPNERPGGPDGPPIDPSNWASPIPAMPLSDFTGGPPRTDR